MKSIKKFLYEKQVEIIMCVLTAFFTVLVLMLCGCAPTKRIVKTDTTYRSETSHVDSMTQVASQKIDLVMRSVSELRETMAEWLNENIDYTEQRYDSLGRLISNIKQTTNRSGGKEKIKTDNQESYMHLMAYRFDSIMSKRINEEIEQLRSKEAVVEKVGFAWWQQLLMVIGAISIIYFVVKIYLKIAIRK